MWGLGVSVYLVAVFHRSTLGVAATEAFSRFGINASALSTFVMLQMIVYVGMQIPVGVLADRFGPKRMLLTGLVLIVLGQTAFALSTAFVPALGARALIGCGDAMTFVSVLRLAVSWFPSRRVALVSQLTSALGVAGNLASAIPLTILLHRYGWTPAFLSATGVAVVAFVIVAPTLKNSPPGTVATSTPPGTAEILGQLKAAWRTPSTRLGLWLHFASQFPTNVFVLLWGVPFLVQGQGLSAGAASALLTTTLLATVGYGPLLGRFIARRPDLLLHACLAGILAPALAWAAVLAWPGHAPIWLLTVLALLLGAGYPSSMIGFDVARTGNPASRAGTVSGIVNVGGGAGAVLAMFGIGLVLDLLTPASTGTVHYSEHAFRLAMCVQFAVLGLGLLLIAHAYVRAGREEHLPSR
jgi:MFS family permease